MSDSDLAIDVFLALRAHFFDDDVQPRPFVLKQKGRDSKEAPLDRHIHGVLQRTLGNGIEVFVSGPNTSPDLVVLRRRKAGNPGHELLDTSAIISVEVKKVEREGGNIRRKSGVDFNSTPPCDKVRIYRGTSKRNAPLNVRGFYLFVCQETIRQGFGAQIG